MIDLNLMFAPASIASFSPNLVHDAQVMLQFDFMRRALLAGTAVSLVAGLIGYFVIIRRLIFTSDVLSHVAFPGALGAILLGVSPIVGVIVFSISAAFGMGLLGTRSREQDVTTGTLQTWIFGLGALLLSLYTSGHSSKNSAAGVNVLFGSILGIQSRVAWTTVAGALLTIVVLLIVARPLLYASIDPVVASARGVPVKLLSYIFLVLLALTVAEAVQVVGVLLLIALLVTPAAIARRLVSRPFAALILSAGLALLFTWVGLTLGFYLPYPVSFCLTSVAFVSYVVVVIGQRLWRGREVRVRSVALPSAR